MGSSPIPRPGRCSGRAGRSGPPRRVRPGRPRRGSGQPRPGGGGPRRQPAGRRLPPRPDTGKTTGAAAGNLLAALEDAGYEPRQEGYDSDTVVLGNCPFHRLARQFTTLVCGANLQLLRGVADGAGDSRVAQLNPGPGRCCVRLRSAAQ